MPLQQQMRHGLVFIAGVKTHSGQSPLFSARDSILTILTAALLIPYIFPLLSDPGGFYQSPLE